MKEVEENFVVIVASKIDDFSCSNVKFDSKVIFCDLKRLILVCVP